MDKPAIEAAIRQILKAIGEDPEREGLVATPRRMANMYEELFSGLVEDPRQLLATGFEAENHKEMVVVKDIPFYSMCVPSRQTVDAVAGQKRAADVGVGDRLYTLDRGELRITKVVAISSRRTRELICLDADPSASIYLTSEHPVMTPGGWAPAGDLKAGDEIEWVQPRQYAQQRYPRTESCDLGYTLGAIAADASIQGARPAAMQDGKMTRLYRSSRRDQTGGYGRLGFTPAAEAYGLRDSRYVRVRAVSKRPCFGKQPFTVYTFTCSPYPTFCVGGILTHNCEHHLMPFHGHAHVGYIPEGRIIGISKIARLVESLAKRPQIQERLTSQIADLLCEEGLRARGAAVVIEAEHLCMTARGVKKPGSKVVTSASRGIFREDPRTRAEFFSIIGGRS